MYTNDLQQEGLSHMWSRHALMHEMLWAGLEELGLQPYVPNVKERLVTVNTIKVLTSRSACFPVVSVGLVFNHNSPVHLCLHEKRCSVLSLLPSWALWSLLTW
jgi:hypothetical protein